ncbi:MAG: D-aminoacylase, partial [Gemmatimonadaceae bacterium]|nr:D-aminoacylase [Gemmatimonadaceae bacterium]
MRRSVLAAIVALATLTACTERQTADLILRGGTIHDGTGDTPYTGDVVIQGDSIVLVGDASEWRGTTEVNVSGLAVAPGFINMLSWGTESLLHDGRGLSDVMQGVTLEVFGEGTSMGPINDT